MTTITHRGLLVGAIALTLLATPACALSSKEGQAMLYNAVAAMLYGMHCHKLPPNTDAAVQIVINTSHEASAIALTEALNAQRLKYGNEAFCNAIEALSPLDLGNKK
jgi:hypothetical protein